MTKRLSFVLLLLAPLAAVQPAHGGSLLFRHTDLGHVGSSSFWSKGRLHQGRMRVTLGRNCNATLRRDSFRCDTLWDRHAWHQASARRRLNPWTTKRIPRFDYRRYFNSYSNLYPAKCGHWPRPYRCHASGWAVGWLDGRAPAGAGRYPNLHLMKAHQNWCGKRFRSYRISDNTFKPAGGPRRRCQSPYAR